ncbi:hypothetical protein JG687_00004886 [Phytophthora cactorum]|uniref:Uncharacterized protein n=1 Tax=Phytophthora cactorum TaxID=29920 RepID=A0A8T1US24_9STRA|nr:hypothetical protein JG687_00004886 [Phytophthora cactorum]
MLDVETLQWSDYNAAAAIQELAFTGRLDLMKRITELRPDTCLDWMVCWFNAAIVARQLGDIAMLHRDRDLLSLVALGGHTEVMEFLSGQGIKDATIDTILIENVIESGELEITAVASSMVQSDCGKPSDRGKSSMPSAKSTRLAQLIFTSTHNFVHDHHALPAPSFTKSGSSRTLWIMAITTASAERLPARNQGWLYESSSTPQSSAQWLRERHEPKRNSATGDHLVPQTSQERLARQMGQLDRHEGPADKLLRRSLTRVCAPSYLVCREGH